MNVRERASLAVVSGVASAALIGVISLGVHADRLWPGMAVAFVAAAISTGLALRAGSRRRTS